MKKIFYFFSVLACLICMTGCPDSIQGDTEEEFIIIVRANSDYRDYVVAYLGLSEGDTVVVNPHSTDCLEFICDRYYRLNMSGYEDIIFLDIKRSDWVNVKDTIIAKNHILDEYPFVEVYKCYKKYDISQLKTLIGSNNFSQFKRIR